jgi:dTDP-4-amino-4,6-dideoxygalactose transaminase
LEGQGAWPVAERLARTVMSLPMHHGLTEEHFGTIEHGVRAVASRYGG